MRISVKNKFFTREICVCAHLTQTRYAQKACAEMRINMEKEIKRDYYLEQLIKRKDNGLIKIVTGIRRCGKSYLLRTLFKNHLLENGVDEKHIIEMSFDLFDNIEYRNPKIFYPWAKEQLKDNEKYYFLLDEVPLLDEFVSVLNGLADKKTAMFLLQEEMQSFYQEISQRNLAAGAMKFICIL